MYNFKDLTPGIIQPGQSSVAMTWDGQKLEDIIPGYKTLNVEGRELISNSPSLFPKVPGRDGDIINDQTLPSRYITVFYLIDAGSSEELRDAYNKLNAILRNPDKTDKPFSFADEPGFTFYGRLEDSSSVDPYTNKPVGYFRLFCSDPFKYGPLVSLASLGSVDDYKYPLKIDQIKITIPSNVSKVTIHNQTTGRRIILNGTYTSGQVLLIENGNITLNDQNIKSHLDYIESDWHTFNIRVGDTISVTPSVTPIITVRRRLL